MKRFLRALALAGLFLSATFAFSKTAQARDYRLDAHLNLGFYGTLGAGMRVDIPIMKKGLLHGIKDDLSITFGADLFWIYKTYADVNAFGLSIPVAAQWNIQIGRSKWTYAPELGIMLTPFNYKYLGVVWPHIAPLSFRYKFNAKNEFLIRGVYPTGLQVGLTF